MSSELLKQGKVDLATFPFARALADLWSARRTGTVSLKLHHLEKSIIIKDGSPVFASSNIAHESLGQVLIKRHEVEEGVIIQALSRAVESDRYLGEVLVEMKVLAPYELFTAMRRCLGAIVLDAFRWTEGELLFDANEPDVDGKVLLKANGGSLVLRGVSGFSPIEQVQGDLGARDDQQFQARKRLGERRKTLTFNAIESRVVRHLAEPVTVAELAAKGKVDLETAHRLLYALALLNYAAHPAEVVKEEATTAPTAAPVVEPGAEQPEVTVLSDEEKREIDEIYLRAKSQSFFELLGVRKKAVFGEIKAAFLDLARRFGPLAFRDRQLGDRGEQLEEIFLILARAYGVLSDPHDRATYLERLKKQEESRRRRAKAKSDEQFSIETDIFQAEQHIDNGKKQLAEAKPDKAREHFQFAMDCEPQNATALACYGYASYLVDPANNLEMALNKLQRAMAIEPANVDAYFFLGLIYELQGDVESAYKAFSLCVQRSPGLAEARTALERVRQARLQAK